MAEEYTMILLREGVITVRDPEKAFADALASGRLTLEPGKTNTVFDYMYMYTEDGVDQFKHVMTRAYLAEQVTP